MSRPASAKVLEAFAEVIKRTGRNVFVRRVAAIKGSDRPAVNLQIESMAYEDVLGDGMTRHTLSVAMDIAEQETTGEELAESHDVTAAEIIRVVGESLEAFEDPFAQMIQDIRFRELSPNMDETAGVGVATLGAEISYQTPRWDHTKVIGQSAEF